MNRKPNAPWRLLAAVLALALGPLANAAATPAGAEAASPRSKSDGRSATKSSRPYRLYESPKGASLRIRYAAPIESGDRLDRGILRESPRATATRVPRARGSAPDLLDRELLAESPRAVTSRTPRLAGASPDRLDRTPLENLPGVRSSEDASRLAARR